MANVNNNQNNVGRETQGPKAPKAPTALNPLIPSLTQPAKSLVEKGYISQISVIFSPTGTVVKGKPGVKLQDAQFVANTDYGVGELIERARALGLVGAKVKKTTAAQAQPLPAKSLCARDFAEDKIPALQARCNAVASACGGGPLVGRVRSASRFTENQTTAYRTWWGTASPADRLLSLTDNRNRQGITPGQIDALGSIQCPFRGTLDFVVSQDDEGEVDEEE